MKIPVQNELTPSSPSDDDDDSGGEAGIDAAYAAQACWSLSWWSSTPVDMFDLITLRGPNRLIFHNLLGLAFNLPLIHTNTLCKRFNLTGQ